MPSPAPVEDKGKVQETAPATGAPPQEQAAVVDNATAPPAASAPLADAALQDPSGEAMAKKAATAEPSTTAQQPLLAAQAPGAAENEAAVPLAAASEPRALMAKPAAAPPAGAGAAPLSLATWQEQLRHDCTRPPTPEQLAALAKQGRQLLASASVDEAGRQRIHTLLAPLEGQQEVETRCKAILEILGPAPVP